MVHPFPIKPSRDSWLQVPVNVAEQWATISGISRQQGSQSLGRIRKRTRQLEMSDEVYQSGKVGRTYEFETQHTAHVPMVIFSEAGGTHGMLQPMHGL
jgi:hypothetical protein